MSMLGQADLGIATLNDMVQNASMIAGLNRSVPLIADADTGYGGELPKPRGRSMLKGHRSIDGRPYNSTIYASWCCSIPS